MPRELIELLQDPPPLPITPYLSDIVALAHNGIGVIQSPPGSGKTTLVPPTVAYYLSQSASAVPQRVLVTQPRRIAARATAQHIADLLNEQIGATAGYSIRGEKRTGPQTIIEMVTPGLLVRRLQANPELPGVGAIIFDEVHERHLDSDLALALALDVKNNLRDDLIILAMSATVEADKTAQLLESTVLHIATDSYTLTIRWCPPPVGVTPLSTTQSSCTMRVNPLFLQHIA